MELVGAGLAGNQHQAAAGTTKLSLVVVFHHPKLLHRFQGRVDIKSLDFDAAVRSVAAVDVVLLGSVL